MQLADMWLRTRAIETARMFFILCSQVVDWRRCEEWLEVLSSSYIENTIPQIDINPPIAFFSAQNILQRALPFWDDGGVTSRIIAVHETQIHVYLYLQKNIYSAHSTISASSKPTRGIHNVIYLGKTLWMYYNSGICWSLIFQAGEAVTCVDTNIVTVYILLFISTTAHVVHLE